MAKRQWQASPETRRVVIDADEDIWIEVKDDLRVADEKAITLGVISSMKRGGPGADADAVGEFGLDHRALSFGKVLAYVVDWNVPGPNGKTLAFTRANVESLTGDAFQLIADAVDAHIAAMDQEKKARSGSPASDPSSSSAA